MIRREKVFGPGHNSRSGCCFPSYEARRDEGTRIGGVKSFSFSNVDRNAQDIFRRQVMVSGYCYGKTRTGRSGLGTL